jgi:hypothetical protein
MELELTDVVKKVNDKHFIVNAGGGPYHVRKTDVFNWVICISNGNDFLQYAPGKFAINLKSAEGACKALLDTYGPAA